jgi:hypothetical protein
MEIGFKEGSWMEKKADGGKKLAFIMAMHLLVAWTLSIWSYTGTTSGEAVRNFFKFASATIPSPTDPNYVAMMAAPVMFIGGIVMVRRLLDWIFDSELC